MMMSRPVDRPRSTRRTALRQGMHPLMTELTGLIRRASLAGLTLLAAMPSLMLPPLAQAADPHKTAATPGAYRDLKWDELVPPDWDPRKPFERFRNLPAISDDSAQADEVIQAMRTAWDNAPVKPELNGARIRINGYLVPIEQSGGKLKEFLLVPYFGACIHTPPPPANQIVHVVMDKPAGGFKSMDIVSVSGTLSAARRSNADMGVSGYRLAGAQMRRYVESGR